MDLILDDVGEVRSDFARREVVPPGTEVWQSSRVAGIQRHVLDRTGVEPARETSIVRLAAGALASAVGRDGGEEFLVLAGSVHDEGSEYPAGFYVRNPIGTASEICGGLGGAVLFVKVHQFARTDTQRAVINTRAIGWRQGLVTGLSVLPLYEHGDEHVALVRWAPSTRFRPHYHSGGEEILVIDGVFEDEHGRYPTGTWLRSPHMSAHNPFTGPAGALIYVKTGHLPTLAK